MYTTQVIIYAFGFIYPNIYKLSWIKRLILTAAAWETHCMASKLELKGWGNQFCISAIKKEIILET